MPRYMARITGKGKNKMITLMIAVLLAVCAAAFLICFKKADYLYEEDSLIDPGTKRNYKRPHSVNERK